MVKVPDIPNDVHSLQEEPVCLRKGHALVIRKLQKELNEEKLKNPDDTTMISPAGQTFHIWIRKRIRCRVTKNLLQREASTVLKKPEFVELTLIYSI